MIFSACSLCSRLQPFVIHMHSCKKKPFKSLVTLTHGREISVFHEKSTLGNQVCHPLITETGNQLSLDICAKRNLVTVLRHLNMLNERYLGN